ncbi:MAG TPA: hypothetical protein VGM88_32640 [Kofleriaceae bacterium]|jgi:hypothetical protein
MSKPLFERADEESDRVLIPTHLYGNSRFTRGVRTKQVNMGGRSSDDIRSDRAIHRMVEDEVVDAFLSTVSAQLVLAEQFGLDGQNLWCLVRTERRILLPSAPTGDIGEFDLIVGRVTDGHVDLSVLALVECKLGKLREGKQKFGSGWGTTQLHAARDLGFDYLLAMHFILAPPSVGSDHSWSGALTAAHFPSEIGRHFGSMKAREADPPFGVVCVGWGQVDGADPLLSGVICPVPLWEAPRLRPSQDGHRAEIKKSLRDLIPEARPAARFFRFCVKCRTRDLISSDDASVLCCESCRQ